VLLSLWLIEKNIDLYRWRYFSGSQEFRADVVSDKYDYLFISPTSNKKDEERIARQITNSLSHDDVVELIANDFDRYSSSQRQALTAECNRAHADYRSGNKVKGIQRLDRSVGGRVLAKKEALRDSSGKKVNPAVAGAMRKYAAYLKPTKAGRKAKREEQ
jgi:hypothetical protein